MTDLVERLRATHFSGRFTLGGGTITADGKGEMWGGERIMSLVNPDGPEAADRLAELEETNRVLREALEKCRDKFAEYTELHRAKLSEYDGKQPVNYAASIQTKIIRNREMREMCDAALNNQEVRNG